MNLLILMEHHLYIDKKGTVWSKKNISHEYFKRYLEVFDGITLCCRMSEITGEIQKDWQIVSGNGMRFYGIKDCIGFKGLLAALPNWYFRMRKAAKDNDVCILRSPSHIAMLFYWFAKRKISVIGLEFVGRASRAMDNDSSLRKLYNSIFERATKRMCKNADGVAYVTKNALQLTYPCKAQLYPDDRSCCTGVYLDVNLPIEKYSPPKWRESKVPSKYVITNIGYFSSKTKGQDVLINIVKVLIDDGYHVELHFIGDGPLQANAEKIAADLGISEHVCFLGAKTNRDEILSLLRDSHFYLTTSFLEGLPRTIIEAMSQSIPCIASNIDGIPEVVEKRNLVECGDVNGFVNRIEELLNDWSAMVRESHASYEKALEYQWAYQAKRETAFYESLRDIAESRKGNKAQ